MLHISLGTLPSWPVLCAIELIGKGSRRWSGAQRRGFRCWRNESIGIWRTQPLSAGTRVYRVLVSAE